MLLVGTVAYSESMRQNDWCAARALFPVFRHWTHLNTATFGPLPSPTVRAVHTHFASRDESAALDFLDWFDRLDGLRAKIARLIGAEPSDIGFCPNAGTALSWFLHGIVWRPGDEILGLDLEFPNNLYAPLLLEARGIRFRMVRAKGQRLDPELFLDALTARTRLVLLSSVNYLNGLRPPLEVLGPELRRRGILLCIDGTQSVGVLRHDATAIPADFLIVSGYKWMLAPAGAGFFYAPPATREWLPPSVVSWRSHRGWRDVDRLHHGRPDLLTEAAMYEGGIQAFTLLFGLEASLDLILEYGPEAIERRALGLARDCRAVLQSLGGVLPDGAEEPCDSPIVTASFPGRDLAQLCQELQEKRIVVSARHGHLRASFHFFNNQEDVQQLGDALAAGMPSS